MQALLFGLGFIIISAVVLDVVVTALTVGGGGPITSRLSCWLWRIALWIHRSRPNHRLLTIAGWLILTGMVLLWLLAVWAGWILIFCTHDLAVVDAKSSLPATISERIYFVGYTLSTLGLGDYLPGRIEWQMATAIMSTNGFLLVTLAIAYLLPVVSAGVQRRRLAAYITTLGGTPDDILARAWNGKDFGQLDQHFINLTPMIIMAAEQHLAYPVLHYFHTVNRSRAMTLSFVALDEALTLLQYSVAESHRPDQAALDALRRANTTFLQNISSAYITPAEAEPPFCPLDLLQAEGIPTQTRFAAEHIRAHLSKRRRLLLALLQNDGWQWNDVASRKTTNRGSDWDDTTELHEVALY